MLEIRNAADMLAAIILPIFVFLLGIALLWGGTGTVLRRVPKLAAWLRVSPLVVTVLVVGMDGKMSRLDGLILLASYYPYSRGTLEEARRQRKESAVAAGARFVRLEAVVMILIFALFLAAQFMGFSISLP